MHWSQTESSKWSYNCLLSNLSHPFTAFIPPHTINLPSAASKLHPAHLTKDQFVIASHAEDAY